MRDKLLMSGQTPVAKPAWNAAPRAVVSRLAGRSTGTSTMSARNWQSHAFAVIPPSTRMAAGAALPSAIIALTKSWLW